MAAGFFKTFLFVAAVDEIKSNKNDYEKNNNANNDPYPERNCKAGTGTFANFKLNKKNGGKGCNVNGCGGSRSGRKKFYFNNNVVCCLVCKGRKSGDIADCKAINAVFFNKCNVCNCGFEIGFGIIEIGVFAVGHVIFAVIIVDAGNMCHCKDIAVKTAVSFGLGSVKGIGYGAHGIVVVCKTVNKKGKVECCKSIAVCNECGSCCVGGAAAIDCHYAELGISADVFAEEEFDSGYGNIAGNAVCKADGFEYFGFFNFRSGAAFRTGFGTGFAGTGTGAGAGSNGRAAAGRGSRFAGRSGRRGAAVGVYGNIKSCGKVFIGYGNGDGSCFFKFGAVCGRNGETGSDILGAAVFFGCGDNKTVGIEGIVNFIGGFGFGFDLDGFYIADVINGNACIADFPHCGNSDIAFYCNLFTGLEEFAFCAVNIPAFEGIAFGIERTFGKGYDVITGFSFEKSGGILFEFFLSLVGVVVFVAAGVIGDGDVVILGSFGIFFGFPNGGCFYNVVIITDDTVCFVEFIGIAYIIKFAVDHPAGEGITALFKTACGSGRKFYGFFDVNSFGFFCFSGSGTENNAVFFANGFKSCFCLDAHNRNKGKSKHECKKYRENAFSDIH